MLWCRRNPETGTPELAAIPVDGKSWRPAVPPSSVRKSGEIVSGVMLVRAGRRFSRDLRSKADGAPFWLCEADLAPYGEIPGKVPARIAPWGIPIPPDQARGWGEELRKLGPCNVLVAYHGTCSSLAVRIQRDGLAESRAGMLGRGVYLTHFWRAAMRYARMDQGYKLRKRGGAVVRVYVRGTKTEPPSVLTRDGSEGNFTCHCGKCTCDKYRGQARMRRMVDHEGLWRGRAVHGVHVPPCRGDTVDPKTGTTRWLARSDEFVFRGEFCYAQEICRVAPAAGDLYDLYDAESRDVCVE